MRLNNKKSVRSIKSKRVYLLTILLLVVSEDLRNKRVMDAKLQTKSPQWSRTLDKICSKVEGVVGREGSSRCHHVTYVSVMRS